MAIPALALLGIQAGGGLLAAQSEIEAGKIEERNLKFQAENETINARLRNNERMSRLLDVMAINNASLGMRGISSEGSPQTILEADVRKASRGAQSDLFTARSASLSLRARASAARRTSNIRAASSLLGTAADIGKTGVKKPGSKNQE